MTCMQLASSRVDGLTPAHSTVDVSPAYDAHSAVLQQGAWLVAADFN